MVRGDLRLVQAQETRGVVVEDVALLRRTEERRLLHRLDRLADRIRPVHLVGPEQDALLVLVAVLFIKYVLFRRVSAVGEEADSTAAKADAWHHLSDAIKSAAAFVGISLALWGGPGWEQADDWAALFASGVIFYNGVLLMKPALHDLMDRMPGAEIIEAVRSAAERVPGAMAVEKLSARKAGLVYYVDIHVQADPSMSLRDSHELSGAVKSSIRSNQPWRSCPIFTRSSPCTSG